MVTKEQTHTPTKPLGGKTRAGSEPSVPDLEYQVKYLRAFDSVPWSMLAVTEVVLQLHPRLAGDIGADLALRGIDPLLDFGQELIDQLRTGGRRLVDRPLAVIGSDITGDGVVGDTGDRTRGWASPAELEIDDVVLGRSHDRQRATLRSANGQLRGRLRAVSRGRRHSLSSVRLDRDTSPPARPLDWGTS